MQRAARGVAVCAGYSVSRCRHRVPLLVVPLSGSADHWMPKSKTLRHRTPPTTTRQFSVFSFLPSAKPRGPREAITTPPPLPDAHFVRVGSDCALQYIDLRANTTSTSSTLAPTLVLLHGAPGTYQDFRYLIPFVQQHLPTARIIGINFPGFGGSTVDDARSLELLEARRATQLTYDALRQLIPDNDEQVFLVGHSFGGHAALDLAALNLRGRRDSLSLSGLKPMDTTAALSVKGLVLLAAAGMHPHRVLRPRENALVIHTLKASPPVVRHALSAVIKWFYATMLRFPSDFPASHFVAGIVRAGTTDFEAIRDNVLQLREVKLPSFSAWSSDDEFMEEEIPIALADALGSEKRLAFAGAGHNLQKTRAEALAKEIAVWVEQVQAAGPSTRCDKASGTSIEIWP